MARPRQACTRRQGRPTGTLHLNLAAIEADAIGRTPLPPLLSPAAAIRATRPRKPWPASSRSAARPILACRRGNSLGSTLIAMMEPAHLREGNNGRRKEAGWGEDVGNPCSARDAFGRHDDIENIPTAPGASDAR
jgi:hypothetical protein